MKKNIVEHIHRMRKLMYINEGFGDLSPKNSNKLFGDVEPTWGGGPNSHKSRHPDPSGKDWESNNAYDIMAPEGTPIYSVTNGFVTKVNDRPPGLISKGGKRIYGDSLSIRGKNGDTDIFYTHVRDIVVEEGDEVKKGQLLAYITKGEMGIPEHVHIGVKEGDLKDYLNVDGLIKDVDFIDDSLKLEIPKKDEEDEKPSGAAEIAAGLTASGLALLGINRPESDIKGIATRLGIGDEEVNVDHVSGVLNKIILSSEGLGTDEVGIHDAIKKLTNCDQLEELNRLVQRRDIDGKEYEDIYDYINSEMNYGDDLFVQSIVKTIDKICPNQVTNKGNQIMKITKSSSLSSGIDSVSPGKLLNDLKSHGLSDKAAKGVVANAYGESGFKVKAKGDSGSYAMSSNRAINIDGKKYCSFGLWQYNVCGGMGVSYLKNYDIDVDMDSDSDKIRVLFDYNKQVEFMAMRIKEEQKKSEKDVKTWINWIVDNVERPSDRFTAKLQRQEFAKRQGWA